MTDGMLNHKVPAPPPTAKSKKGPPPGPPGPPGPPPPPLKKTGTMPPPAPSSGMLSPRKAGIKAMGKVRTLEELQHIIQASENGMSEQEIKEKYGGVKLGCLEMYMSESEFKDVFDVKKDDFVIWPLWKKQAARKEHKICFVKGSK